MNKLIIGALLMTIFFNSLSDNIIPPKNLDYVSFPKSEKKSKGMKVIKAKEDIKSISLENVVYTIKDNTPLHLNILYPSFEPSEKNKEKYPLIIYIQGSAWRKQNLGMGVGQLSRMAEKGYIIAIVEYRSSDIAIFPAQIKDTKTAIRYMLKNSEKYGVDKNKVVVWGDSSGGHTAAMVGATLNEKEYNDEDSQLDIKAIIDFYGPTDISKMNFEPSIQDHISPSSPEGELIGKVNVLENLEKVYPTVVMNHISKEKYLPPFLIIHGNKDRLVPFGQSVLLYDKLKEENKIVEFYQLDGADHGGAPFWQEDILDIVDKFIKENLK